MRVEIVGASNTLYYMLRDHLGSASVTLDASGAIVANGEQRYYPFGESRMAGASLPTDKMFQGQREVSGLGGLYHFGARFYLGKLGRFISADTIVPSFANPQSLNRYAFVLNNPLKYIDPTGHTSACARGVQHRAAADDCADYTETPKPKRPVCNSSYCDLNWKPPPQRKLIEAVVDMIQDLQDELGLHVEINEVYREPAKAHRLSTAYNIYHRNISLEQILQNPVDADGNVWWSDDWLECPLPGACVVDADTLVRINAVKMAGDNLLCYVRCLLEEPAYALEGYPVGDPRRLPNTDEPSVTPHIYGLAVDVKGLANNEEGENPAIDEIARRHGLWRPYVRDPNHPEAWHFELLPGSP